jgi:hypothetical protein
MSDFDFNEFMDLGNGLGGDLVKMAFAGGASKTQGKWNRKLVKSENDLARKHGIKMVKLGNELDMANQKEMYDYRIQQGKAAGMTDYEMFMGPAAGAGGGTTGSGQTLGNQPAQLAANATQAANARLQAQTQLGTAMIQANAQRDVAKTQAEATTGAAGITADATQYKAELEYKIKHKQLVLDEKQYQKDLAIAAANINKTNQEAAKLINETATSDPKFVQMMRRLQMGPQNILVEYAINKYGFNPLDPESVKKSTDEMKRNFLTLVLGYDSRIAKEAFGIDLRQELMPGQVQSLGNSLKDVLPEWVTRFAP